ncbi:putative peptidoglycan biosynthesis protein MviN [Corynebacterium pseudopelargi]|uniref:Putative peptidoglycan biosynthesis protein MviN n=1 Tax=Corynebacterium pseudopelargi TaxID=2080757 RepID=A0A3G6IXF6_9CORY|nr:murein biosynthesis integral membrane protein MurJ [Corynebacterium pseudopelargi]AZA10326.1 putative peptidoglycan biosynthesis protein MviN [Corynebacterium pseudopelargi]
MTHSGANGIRHRIVDPSAPAPVPEIQQTPAPQPEQDHSRLASPANRQARVRNVPAPNPEGEQDAKAVEHAMSQAASKQDSAEPAGSNKASDADVVRAGGSMAIATLFSRITGFLRNVMITATLGGAIASAFNVANTLPNLITEIVLGAVLTSLVVPVLVRAEKEDPDRGEAFIRRLFTLAATLLISVTLLAVIGAPWLTELMLDSESKVNVTQATSFAYLLLPQIFFYGIFALLMAVLNTKGIFKPGAWAPVANNVITLAVLALYMFLPGKLDASAQSPVTDPHVLLLGLGTTLGVVVQALIMLPPILRSGVSLKPLWGIDARLKQFGGMAVAIVVYVGISQLGYVVTTRIAANADAAAPNIYQQHWLLLQVPYGIIGVTLLTAIMPRLSRNAADGDDKAVVKDLVMGSKLTFLALIPIVVFFTAFGEQIGRGLFAYREFDATLASILGWTLSFSAFTLLPYALVLLHLRVFYAREEAWTPTLIIAGITTTKILLSYLAPVLATDPSKVVILLGAANGFGFLAGAIIGATLLRRKLGSLGTGAVVHTSVWALGASLVGVAIALGLDFLIRRIGVLEALGSVGVLVELAIVGVVFLAITGIVLSRSGLQEVASLGGSLQRIPGLNRIIKVKEKELMSAPAATSLTPELLALDDTFNATPVPPPMSAGVVRGPRLVPGARVSDGRFRLLADHGSVSQARFWQAREVATDREVALVFVDTSGSAPQAPLSPAAAAGAAAEVSRRTRALGKLRHPAIAPNIEVLSYRNGCLVVADWVAGTTLASVAEEGADPFAAAYALELLGDATEAAKLKAHTPLGLDNRSRIRISTDGVAVLAFPAVLPDASVERDQSCLRTALCTLVDAEQAPAPVAELMQVPAADLPEALRALPDTADQSPDQLQVSADRSPKPSNEPGFGSKNMTRTGRTAVALAVVALVTMIALGTAYLTAVIGARDEKAPIDTNSISREHLEKAIPILAKAEKASVWADGAGEQEEIPAVVDNDATTTWLAQGNARGVLLSFAQPIEPTKVIVNVDEQTKVEVYVGEDAFNLNTATLLGDGEVRGGSGSVKLRQQPETTAVLVWFESIPEGEPLEVKDVQVVARP